MNRIECDPVFECYGCGDYYEDHQMEAIDVSREGEYYPRFIYVCLGCNNPNVPSAVGGGNEA